MYDEDGDNDGNSNVNNGRFNSNQPSGRNNNTRVPPRSNTADGNHTTSSDNTSGYQPRSIAPNQERRAETLKVAQEETEDYNAWRQSNKLTHVSEVGKVGGGDRSIEESRSQMQREMNNLRIRKPAMKTQWKDENRKREEEEINQKKLEARKKAEQNEERKKREAEEMKKKYEEPHRLCNEGFLANFERKASQKSDAVSQTSLKPSTMATENIPGSRTDNSIPDTSINPTAANSHQDDIGSVSTLAVDQASGDFPLVNSSQVTSGDSSQLSEDEMLQHLRMTFPYVTIDLLKDVLRSSNYDLQLAASFFLDS